MPVPTSRRIAVLVSGSGTNFQALLDAIERDATFGGEVVVVGSDQPGCAGLERARRAGIPIVATALDEHPDRAAWEAALVSGLETYAPDIVVLAGFMRLVAPGFLARWPQRVVNVHPSLLPAFPGAHAVRDALAHGVKVTGSTVHLVDEEVDHGPIIAQRAVEVLEGDDEEVLHERLRTVEHVLLPAAVKLLCHDRIAVEGRRVRILPTGSADALTPFDIEGAAT
ncbi:MAG: phosphoribosylglycinamide formyltransferase [Nitriliruptorales bacterium]